jgi:FAD/FMN-containing dehydrogenase
VALVEFEGETQAEANEKVASLEQRIRDKDLDVLTEKADTANKDRRYWLIRRESFNLLRQRVKDRVASPFIDDLIVPTNKLTEYIPQIEQILTHDHLIDTIAGHVGNGNFHIIPLMDLADPRDRAKIPLLLKKTAKLVKSFGGTLSGEHNDGLVRGQLLEEMYGSEMAQIFRDVKRIFDPEGIFNPHKKIDATWDYSMAHIRRS